MESGSEPTGLAPRLYATIALFTRFPACCGMETGNETEASKAIIKVKNALDQAK